MNLVHRALVVFDVHQYHRRQNDVDRGRRNCVEYVRVRAEVIDVEVFGTRTLPRHVQQPLAAVHGRNSRPPSGQRARVRSSSGSLSSAKD